MRQIFPLKTSVLPPSARYFRRRRPSDDLAGQFFLPRQPFGDLFGRSFRRLSGDFWPYELIFDYFMAALLNFVGEIRWHKWLMKLVYKSCRLNMHDGSCYPPVLLTPPQNCGGCALAYIYIYNIDVVCMMVFMLSLMTISSSSKCLENPNKQIGTCFLELLPLLCFSPICSFVNILFYRHEVPPREL